MRRMFRDGRLGSLVTIAFWMSIAATSGCGAGPQGAPRVAQFLAIYNSQDLSQSRAMEALELMRREIADPASTAPADLCGTRILALRVIGKYGLAGGTLTSGLRAEAERYYGEGLRYATTAGERGNVESAMGTVLDAGQHSGLAIAYYRRAVALHREAKDGFRAFEDASLLAGAHFLRGDLLAYEATWAETMELARAYFRFPSEPTNEQFWLAYWRALAERMTIVSGPHNNVSGAPNLGELRRIWPELERVGQRFVVPKYRTYILGGDAFAFAGDGKTAQQLFTLARDVGTANREDFENELRCSLVASATYEGRDEWSRCPTPPATWTTGAGFWNTRGRGYQLGGDLAKALESYERNISSFERRRGSYDVAARTAFFRSQARTSYWGKIVVHAARAMKTGAEDDLFEALRTTELVRGRQLGETIDERGGRLAKITSLSELRSRLGPTDAILDYVLTDREALLVVVTHDAARCWFLDSSGRDVGAEARAIAGALSKPGDPHALEGRLRAFGKTLFGPARSLLAGKTRWFVLPDGDLNRVPFDLLSGTGDAYRPITEDVAIVVLPSLAFLTAPSHADAKGLFALGDPSFVRGSDDRGSARGHAFLGKFSALPETRSEVMAIAKLFEGERVSTLLGPEASKSRVQKADFRSFGVLHFATHGVLGRDVPGILEPAIVLSDEPSTDGFLTASDVGRMGLAAKLTVLSACNTGSGDVAGGEGVLGMSRAFLAAGSDAVLVSLWSVDSAATEALMVAFYQRFRAGVPAHEALRQAKLEVRARVPGRPADKRAGSIPAARGLRLETAAIKPMVPNASDTGGWTHPYYWGAFIFVGATDRAR